MILAFVLGESIVHFQWPLWLVVGIILLAFIIIIRKFNLKLLMVIFFSLISGMLLISNQMGNLKVSEEIIESDQITYTGKISKKIFKNEKYYYYIDNIIAVSKIDENLKIGNMVKILGQYQELSTGRNPGCFDEKRYYNSLGISYKIKVLEMEVLGTKYNKFRESLYQLKIGLKETIYEVSGQKEASIFAGIILGESHEIDEEAKELYRDNGIAHILAISGLHISMIGYSVYKILRQRFLFVTSAISAGVIIVSFVLMAGESASGIRALIMFLIMLISDILGRTYDILSAISLSAILILLGNPLILYNTGFLLSFMAVISIAVLLPMVEGVFMVDNKIFKGLSVSLVATLGTSPIIAYSFYQLPTYSVLINLIVLPFVGVLMGSGLLAALLGMFFVKGGVFLIGAGVFFLKFNEVVCKAFEFLPFSNVIVGQTSLFKIMVYYFLILILIFGIKYVEKKNAIISILVILVLCFSLIYTKSQGQLEITLIDVGQGDGILIKNQNKEVFMIDGGSSDQDKLAKYTLIPFLKSEGIGIVDYWFITHMDLDHTSGLMEILGDYKNENIKIKNIILSNNDEFHQEEQEVLKLAQEYDINIIRIKKGDAIKSGELTFKCLHPYLGYHSESKNGYSIVLSLEYKNFEMLFTGDLEDDGERELVAQGCLIDYDILKIAHHGSKASTSEEFLNIIKPEYSVISCGRNNTYGHPHGDLIQRLENVSSEIFITAKTGAIGIVTDGNKYDIDGYIDREEAR